MSGMKKYLSTGLLALLTTAYLTSCSDTDFSGSIIEAKKQAFSENFKAAYGNINPNQDWGFGSASTRGWAFTRGANTDFPGETSFRDNLEEAISKPEIPTTYYMTQNDVLANVTYAKTKAEADWNGWEDGAVVYVDANYATVNDKKNQTIYVVGNVTYESSTQTGIVFVVTENSTLKIKGFGQYESVILAENATLDIRELWSGSTTATIDGGALYMCPNSKVLGSSSSLTFKNDTPVLLSSGCSITGVNLSVESGSVLWNEGTINITGVLSTQNQNAKIYNPQNHRISAASLKMYNNSELFYNDGTATFTGAIEQDNKGGEIINNGTLSGASMLIKAGGKMHNVGTTTITGLTKVDNTGTQWQNDEIFITGDFEVSAYAEEVYNNCKLTVHKTGDTGLFKIYGKFVLQGGDPNDATKSGASVITDNLEWTNNTYMFLGTKSLLKVNKQFLSNNAVDNSALVGPTNGYAVVQAESITRPEANMAKQFGMTYLNNLLVDAGSHFPQGAEDPDNNPPAQPYYKYDESVIFKKAGETTTVTIPQTKCNPGYNTTGGGGGDDTTETRVVLWESGRIFCEDLGSVANADIDYNDLVFDAWIYAKQTLVNGKITSESHYRTFIQLLAAGGTIPIQVGYTDVHSQFAAASDKMINTYIENGISPVRAELCVTEPLPSEIVIRNEYDEFYNNRLGGFCLKNIPIFIRQGEEVFELTADLGGAPHKFCAPIGTKWVGERIGIGSAYTGFTGWVSNNITPWQGDVAKSYLYDFDYNPSHGDTMTYDPNDDPSITDTSNGTTTGSGTQTGGGTSEGGPDFGTLTGTEVYTGKTTLSSGSGMTIAAANFNDAVSGDIYIYGTGTGSVEVNGASTENVTPSVASAPGFNFSNGFGFTRSTETPVVKKCTLGPKQLHGNPVDITGNNFTVYKVTCDSRLPSVSQPTGTILINSTSGIEMDWSRGQQKIPASQLTGIGAGTIIRMAGVGYADNINTGDNNTSWQVELDVESPWTVIENKSYTSENRTGAVTLEFTLNADQAAALLNSQLVVQGINFILKYVTIDNTGVTNSQTEPTFNVSTYTWTGKKDLGNWNESVSLKASEFSDAFEGLGAGTVIHVYGFGNNTNAQTWCAKILRNDGYWQNLDNTERKFEGAEMYQAEHVSWELTEQEAKNLKKCGELIVQGQYFTARYVYIDNTKAEPIQDPIKVGDVTSDGKTVIEVLWLGPQAGYFGVDFATSKLASLQTGDKIRFYGLYQSNYKVHVHNSGWSSYSIDGWEDDSNDKNNPYASGNTLWNGETTTGSEGYFDLDITDALATMYKNGCGIQVYNITLEYIVIVR